MNVQAAPSLLPYDGDRIELSKLDCIPPVGEAMEDMFERMYGDDPDKEGKWEPFMKSYLHSCQPFKLNDAGKYKSTSVTWVPGSVVGNSHYGPYQAEIALVNNMLDVSETAKLKTFSGEIGAYMHNVFTQYGLDMSSMYATSLTKFSPPYEGISKMPAKWIKECLYFLYQELITVNPKYVLVLGTEALKAMLGKKATLKAHRGQPTTVPWLPDAKILVTSSPYAVMRNPERTTEFMTDIRHFSAMVKGNEQVGISDCNYETIWDINRLKQICEYLKGFNAFAVDVETTGLDSREKELLTIQICPRPKEAYTIALKSLVSGKSFQPSVSFAIRELRKVLCRPGVQIIGHNFRFDMKWLQNVGLDLEQQFSDYGFDTMLASHLLNEVNDHDLSSCTLRDTNMGRYDSKLEERFAAGHKHWTVPDDELHQYGAADTDATYRLYEVYRDRLWAQHLEYCERHGAPPYESIYAPDSAKAEESGWPATLWNLFRYVVIPVTGGINEMEVTGFLTDEDLLLEMIGKFENKRDEILEEIRTILGMPGFNPRSPLQCQEVLFGDPAKTDHDGRVIGCLGLDPVKTTGKRGKLWEEVKDLGKVWYEPGDGWKSNQYAPCTDGETLAILADEQGSHVAHLLRNFRFIDQICKNFLAGESEDPKTETMKHMKGLIGLSGSDGRLHTSISQITDTGRWRSSKPNCFSGDTEVLTQAGWMRFDCLVKGINLAQYDIETGEIDFSIPLGYVEGYGELLHITTDKQIDLCVTPDHECLIRRRKTKEFQKVPASQYPEDCEQIQAGIYKGPGCLYTDVEIILIAAMQADGHILKSGYGVDFSFTKKRKADRLEKALNDRQFKYSKYVKKREGGKTRYRYYIPKQFGIAILTEWKHFDSRLLALDYKVLQKLADEVTFWGGCYKRKSMYASKIKQNTDWVQILYILTGRRAKVRKYTSNGGSISWQADASSYNKSMTTNRKIESIGSGDTYCVKMPKGTVIVRRNGKVAITGQCQNLPKGREGDIAAIFGDQKIPPIRQAMIAKPGHVIIEADFNSAESFTLAAIAGDEVMMSDLMQKDEDGNDISLHSITACKVFNLDMSVAEYDKARKSDKALAGLRVAAKSINFGIPYGRSGPAIARQVMREGVECTESDGQCWIDEWYNNYKKNAQYLQFCRDSVYNPGYIVTPWGRHRRFTKSIYNDVNSAMEREACNFPIQSTVADAMNLAVTNIKRKRDLLQLRARMILAVHDAVVLEVPYEEVKIVMEILQQCMSDDLEVPGTGLHYQIEIDIGANWSEPADEELLRKCGIES